jgi:hypothetical protein
MDIDLAHKHKNAIICHLFCYLDHNLEESAHNNR